MKNPIIYRYVTTGWLKIVSFFKTIFNSKGIEGKSGMKIASNAAAKFDRISIPHSSLLKALERQKKVDSLRSPRLS